ncbi:SDR family NAD(P)-dependent oxidoreductase [Azospirillum canadense]|uniref:SDR family NAD(P)-dependent oxidoreductase n=1 Tax=Azospirillum canadense TaxID=403962 RepID=UPI002226F393|nr:SDR family NAD(P)-dependent oxidoreductase [Azospirillum canadense]MCW2242450.1 NAD(P)-dependent dehydrogenase (short-subunit alcohol dehydrogenase family) [Azospirillum canadense]
MGSGRNERAIVFGVGPGLGLALVRRLAGEGMAVAMVARDVGKLERLRDAAGLQGVTAHACDVSKGDEVAAVFGAAFDAIGAAPDLVVFNASTFEPAGILDIDPTAFERCWRIDCLGGFHVGQQAARRMVPEGRGTILFTGATASLRGSARLAQFAVAKFGLRALAQCMARELGPQGIHVGHVVIDGQIATPTARERQPDRDPDTMLDPDALAETYVHLHRQPRTVWTLELDVRPAVEKF